jgi:ADP-ribosylglycohydrolase
VLLAINHSGDSDSTGAITGNLLGATLGREAIPQKSIDTIELRDEIDRIAQELV